VTGAASWERQRVFVTGCTGLLGSWLTLDLVEAGAQVVGLVRDGVPRSNFMRLGLGERIVTVRGEVENAPLLERIVNEYEVEVVFHLAAQTIVTTANANPMSTYDTNVRGTWNLLEACRRHTRLRAVVIASSDKAYGAQPELPYHEDAPLAGRHPYDASKSCADLLARTYWETYRVPVAVTRCGNLYGGGDLNFSRLVPGTIRAAHHGEPPVIRSDGTPLRDYFYARDAARAYLALAEAVRAGECHGEAFNFSYGQAITVLDMTRKVLALAGRPDLRPRIVNEASGEILHQYLSAAKARARLGWQPHWTVDEGLRETITWYREWFARDRRRVDHAAA
jgi:CDP-glucose 4,6-dehydratase